MRKILLAILAVAVFLLGGCIKMHMETDIAADGSGTCTISYGMPRDVADAVQKLSTMDNSGMGNEDMPALEDMQREEVEKACKEAGVELIKHEFVDDETGVHLTMTLGFESVGQFSEVLESVVGGSSSERLGIFRNAEGQYVLKSVAVPGDEEEDEEVEETEVTESQDMAEMQEAMQVMGVLMQHMAELDIRMAITVPGDVISSNAMEVEGRTSIWALNAANMMQAEETDMDPVIVFASDGVKIDAEKLPE
jgi:hypothetical protein